MTGFSATRILAVLVKEFKQLSRDRLTYAMILVLPIVQLMLFGYAINSDPRHMPTALLVQENSAFARSIAAFVAGVGTGGTLTGVARCLREQLSDVLIVAVEPKSSPVLSGGKPGLHAIQGLGAGFIPANLDRSLIDEIVTVSDVAAERSARRLAQAEGLLVGPSAGANVHVACAVAQRLTSGNVVTILCDSGERYLF